jgi:acetylornithine deacetylase/succinyl-diaminopimelate desuccinylase-like protein
MRAERCRSGRTGRSRKPLWAQVHPGFESLSLRQLGFSLTRTEADGRPFLIARRIEDPDLPTVLSYSHGDTVPGMEGRWREGRDPWTLTEAPAKARLYGRGIADNKGQFWVNLTAMRAVLETRGSSGSTRSG